MQEYPARLASPHQATPVTLMSRLVGRVRLDVGNSLHYLGHSPLAPAMRNHYRVEGAAQSILLETDDPYGIVTDPEHAPLLASWEERSIGSPQGQVSA